MEKDGVHYCDNCEVPIRKVDTTTRLKHRIWVTIHLRCDDGQVIEAELCRTCTLAILSAAGEFRKSV